MARSKSARFAGAIHGGQESRLGLDAVFVRQLRRNHRRLILLRYLARARQRAV
jgi:hypothetical protein